MSEIFSSIYEFGGLLPLYSADLSDHLRGFDVSCTNYSGSPYYTYVGFFMLTTCLFAGALQYYIIDSPRYMRRSAWWITTTILSVVNLVFAFVVVSNSLKPGKFCENLVITTGDVVGFAMANAICAFLFYLIMTSIPVFRAKSINCKYTTFYKP